MLRIFKDLEKQRLESKKLLINVQTNEFIYRQKTK
jgi:hypothetical protein